MDFFIKLTTGKIQSGLSGTIVNLFSVIPVLMFMVWQKVNGEAIFATKMGTIYSIIAGLSIGLATVFIYKMFASGTNLSLGIPILRTGVVIIAAVLGLVLLKEGINVKWLLGLTFSIIGIYFLVISKS